MIGVRGHDIGILSAKGLAQAVREMGFDGIQLVPYKAIEGIDGVPGTMTDDLAQAIGAAFSEEHVAIAMVGSYYNMIDDEVAEEGTLRFKEYLKQVKALGGQLVGTETGSYMKNWTYHPDNHSEEALQRVIKVFKDLVAEAEKLGVNVGIEGAYHHVVSTPKRLKQVLDAVDSPNLKVILDPYNFIYPGNYQTCHQIIDEAFELYGDAIVLIHAKDYVVDGDELKMVGIGDGIMDYQHIAAKVKATQQDIAIITEGVTGEDLPRSLAFLRRLFA